MAAIQAVIFLLFLLFVNLSDVAIRMQAQQVAALQAEVNAPPFAAYRAAAQAQLANQQRIQQQAALLQPLGLVNFDPAWLAFMHTLPPQVQIHRVEMDSQGATLQFIVPSLSMVDIHRRYFAESGLVSQVRATHMALYGDEVVYTLVLVWAYGS